MTNVIELNYDTLDHRANVQNFVHAGEGPIDTMSAREDAGFFETAGLVYQQEAVIGSTITYGLEKDRFSGLYNYDRAFNPYAYWNDNKKDYADLEPYMRTKQFHDVINEEQFRDRAARKRKELENRERMANGSGWGMLAGMGLSLFDIATLIPIGGWFQKGNSLMRVGKMALAGGTYTAAQEAILHMQQDLRTQTESIMNIGFGTAIGGGFGVFISARDPSSSLHPTNPKSPFSPKNPIYLGMGRIGKGMSESIVMKPVIKGGKKSFEFVRESSVGAAAVEAGKVVGVGAKAIPRALAKAIPSYRLLLAASSKAREIGQGLFDTGGIIMTTMEGGTVRISVEDFKAHFMAPFEAIFTRAADRFTHLSDKLAEITGRTQNQAVRGFRARVKEGSRFVSEQYHTARGRPPIEKGANRTGDMLEEFEFQDLTYKSLFDDIDEATLDNLRGRFGDEGADVILAEAKAQADDIHLVNKNMEDKMVESGMIKEDQRMGKEYGLAQIWNPRAMRGRGRAQAIRFFTEKFLGKPSDEFLDIEFGMTKSQFDKLGKEEITIGDTKYSLERGLAQRNEILEEWSGDTFERQAMQAEIELAYAENALRDASRDATLAAADLRKNQTEITKATVDEAKAILKKRQAERDKLQLSRDKLKAEEKLIENELRRVEEEQLARMNQFHETGHWVRKYTRERKSEVEQAEDLLTTLEGEGAAYKDINEARGILTDADIRLQNVQEDALTSAVVKAETEKPYNVALARLRGRKEAITAQLNKTEGRLGKLEPRLKVLSEAIESTRLHKQTIREQRVILNSLRKEALKTKQKARTGVKKAKRALKKSTKKGLKNPRGRLPVHEYVEELVDKLGKESKIPRGILEAEAFASARTKDRQIILSKEERREAVQLGLLRNDIYGVMHNAHDDLSTRLAMRQVFGTENSKDVIKAVHTDYENMINSARARGLTEKHIARLEKEQKMVKETIEGSWDKMLGRHALPEDPDSWLVWTHEKLRAWNYIKYGTGFLISSLTDLATVTLTGGFHSFTWKKGAALRATIKGMKNDEIRRIAIASERVLHNSRTLKIADISDMKTMAGIGDRGGIKHNLTSAGDRVVQGLNNSVNFASGMMWWNTRLKALAMIEVQHNLVALMKNYDELLKRASAQDRKAKLEIAKLASIGIGQSQAKRIKQMMSKHEPTASDGVNELGMSRWLDEGVEGHAAYEDVLIALRRVANRAVMTPGSGETPLLMSRYYMKTILQFQTYGFVTLNRFVIPALQRGINYGDMEAILSMGLASGLGTGVVIAKDLLRHGEVKERSPSQWAYDVIDRSGYLMYLTVPSAQVYNWAAWMAGETERPSRYSNLSNPKSLILGPSWGTLSDIESALVNLQYGDTDQAGKHALKLLPMQMYKQVAEQVLFND